MKPEDPMTFPKLADQPRLLDYDHYDKLYFGDHYSAFAIKAKKGFPEQYAKLRYVVANYAGLASRIVADMLFGDPIVIDVKDKNNQTWLDGLIEDNHLITQLYESALANSRRGDSIFKIRIDDPEESGDSRVIIEEITPGIYFPELDPNFSRLTAKKDVLAWPVTSPDGKTTYLIKETHEPGVITTEGWTYDPSSKKLLIKLTDEELVALDYEPTQETKVSRSLIFHIPNVRDGSSFFGTSDYKDLEQLMFALNNRITKIDNILDKHSDPILAVPPGVIDEKGNVRKERLGMFEVDNENSGFNKPEYITWNANLDNAFKEIETIVDMLFMFSEVSPAAVGMDKNSGRQESGTALKLKLMRTIAKMKRKRLYYDVMIKEMLETAMEFGSAWNIKIDGVSVSNPESPEIKWPDGVIPDLTEEIDNEIKRIDAELSSREDAIARLDNLKPEDAKEKAAEILKANELSVPAIANTPGQDKNMPNKTPPKTPPQSLSNNGV